MHKTWCSLEEVCYCILRTSIWYLGHTGWKINDLNPIWVRLLGRSQLSNPSDLPIFTQGMMVLVIFVVLASYTMAGSPIWSCPNNTDTDVSKIKPLYNKGSSILTVMEDISIVCLQTDVFASFGRVFVSVDPWILAHFNASRPRQNVRNFIEMSSIC